MKFHEKTNPKPTAFSGLTWDSQQEEDLHCSFCRTSACGSVRGNKAQQRAPSYQHEPVELRTAQSTNPDHLQELHAVFVPGGTNLKARKPEREASLMLGPQITEFLPAATVPVMGTQHPVRPGAGQCCSPQGLPPCQFLTKPTQSAFWMVSSPDNYYKSDSRTRVWIQLNISFWQHVPPLIRPNVFRYWVAQLSQQWHPTGQCLCCCKLKFTGWKHALKIDTNSIPRWS